jgi:hypothetical protein
MERPRSLPAPDRLWSDSEWERIRFGLYAQTMEDKWNALVEGNRLFLHRSWTGRCIYEAEFTPCEGGWRITEAWLDSAQNDLLALHSAFVEVLISGIILREPDSALWARFTELGGSRGLFSE